MFSRRSFWVRSLRWLSLWTWALPASGLAAAVEVNPVRLDLEGGSRGVAVMLKNLSNESVRFQASMHTWTQDEGGNMSLAPTQEVFFFPAMLTLEPGETRPIRVGISSAPQATERTFRLVVEELPPIGPLPPSAGLKVLTRISVPVFVAPQSKSVDGRVEDVELTQSKFQFRVKNPGTVTFYVRNSRMRGLDEKGERVFVKEEPGWYVLPGGSLTFALKTPVEQCQKIRSLEVEVETDRGVFRQAAPVNASVPCATPETP
ncbi:fimbria/pilus periplasmic chaperone [Myxococcus sp. K38C18041901]|uniref:fimbrial biogenesis chaperone n=1 Tax=Myxococcus guangdongensis TaxID=2906760 RepID=UPI0020A797AC|nr:fimbria/pilus periplasmic chaperone [Myxococcus guangdongensis]MCP3065096.1 fimbria/pilus periplasmic chaperone [Myxococcus guangdongensis]